MVLHIMAPMTAVTHILSGHQYSVPIEISNSTFHLNRKISASPLLQYSGRVGLQINKKYHSSKLWKESIINCQ